MTLILGIDPGLCRTGFGLVRSTGQGLLQHIASGTIEIPSSNLSLPPRLRIIYEKIQEIILRYRPICAAIEQIFINKNAHTTLLLGQARGAAITTLATSNLVVHEYSALQIKKAVTGYGFARKTQVQSMVQRLLQLSNLPTSDEADALACAICHAHLFACISLKTKEQHHANSVTNCNNADRPNLKKRRSKRWTEVPLSYKALLDQ